MQLSTSPSKTRLLGLFLLCASIAAAVVVPAGQSSSLRLATNDNSSTNYPFTICPAALGSTVKIGLPTGHVNFHSINGKSARPQISPYSILNSYQYANNYPVYLQGVPGIPVAWSTTAGSGVIGIPCNSGSLSQWLVGGTAGLASQDLVEIVNSGLASANVQILPYTQKGPITPLSVTVKANSDTQVPLTAIAPGENSVALEVVSSSARIASYLLDHRKTGLSDLGSSYVPEQDQPQSTIYLGGISNGSYAGTKANTQVIRLLDPGSQDANISATIFTTNGAVAPVGLSSFTLAHQKVVDITLPTSALPSPYGIKLSSDQPILASVESASVVSHAFSWAAPLSQVANSHGSVTRLNFAGNQPTLVFLGSHISVRVNWQLSNGKSASVAVTGDLIDSWSAPAGVTTVSLSQLNPSSSEPLYVGAMIGSGAGGVAAGSLSYLTFPSATTQGGATQSASDIRALFPQPH